jgi:hypothetical protein
MFANTQMMGIDIGFPDVCLTPTPAPVPIPYPNIALGPMTVPAVYNVLMSCAPAHNLFSTVVMTNGDNPGVAMGVASGHGHGSVAPAHGRVLRHLRRRAPAAADERRDPELDELPRRARGAQSGPGPRPLAVTLPRLPLSVFEAP